MVMLPLSDTKSTSLKNGVASSATKSIKQEEERADHIVDAILSLPVELEANSGDAPLIKEEDHLEEDLVKTVDEEEAAGLSFGPKAWSSKLDNLLIMSHLLSEFILERMDQISKECVDTQSKERCVEEKRKEHGQKRKANAVPQYNDKKGKTAVAAMLTRSCENRLEVDCNLSEEGSREKEQAKLVPLMTGGKLKPYQIKGVKWLISLWQNGLNGILADEMGLGKTIQTIGFLAHLKGKGMHGPYMIIAPQSTLSKWINEISRFTPSLASIIYCGDKVTRAEIRRKFMPKTVGPDFPIVVLHTSRPRQMLDFLLTISGSMLLWMRHPLKNCKRVLLRDISRIPMENKLLLTGTPLQNNPAELWSLLNFIFPDTFSSHQEFESWFDTYGNGRTEQEETERQRSLHDVSKLQAILRPFILRRLKEDVEWMFPRKKNDISSFGSPIKLYNPSKPGDQRQGPKSLAGLVVQPHIAIEAAAAAAAAEYEDAELEQHDAQGLSDTKYGTKDDSDDENYVPRRTQDTEAGSSAQAAQTNTSTSQTQSVPFDFQQQIFLHFERQARAHQNSQEAQLEMIRNLQAQQQEMHEQAQDREMQAMMFQYMIGSMGHVFQHTGVASPPFSAFTPSPVTPGVAPFPTAAAAPYHQCTLVSQSAFPAAAVTVSGGAASFVPAPAPTPTPVIGTVHIVQPAVVSAHRQRL
ncbi:hypothetical protein ACP70R_048242 [Stipagrostis hirtigluma subsp. patula]